MVEGQQPNEALLRAVARRLGSMTLVETVDVFPVRKPASVSARFDTRYYPDPVRQVELDVRTFVNGDFSVHYREERSDQDWHCRWDRHTNPHNSRNHFHTPPDASTTNATDADYSADFFAVIETVLTDVEQRLGEVWDEYDE